MRLGSLLCALEVAGPALEPQSPSCNRAGCRCNGTGRWSSCGPEYGYNDKDTNLSQQSGADLASTLEAAVINAVKGIAC